MKKGADCLIKYCQRHKITVLSGFSMKCRKIMALYISEQFLDWKRLTLAKPVSYAILK